MFSKITIIKCYEISTIYECIEKLSMIIGLIIICKLYMVYYVDLIFGDSGNFLSNLYSIICFFDRFIN